MILESEDQFDLFPMHIYYKLALIYLVLAVHVSLSTLLGLVLGLLALGKVHLETHTLAQSSSRTETQDVRHGSRARGQ
jgi:hypothetical protein